MKKGFFDMVCIITWLQACSREVAGSVADYWSAMSEQHNLVPLAALLATAASVV